MHYFLFLAGAVFGLQLCSAMPCSLIVNIEATSGYKEVPVVVVESDGTKWEAKSIGGVAKFCGLGVHAVTVSVGKASCNTVTVNPVFLDENLASTKYVNVYLDDLPCYRDVGVVPPIGCPYHFRVFGPNREILPRASIRITSGSIMTDHKADEYGRVFYLARPGRNASVISSAPGFESVHEEIACVRAGLITVERVVALPRKK